MSHTYNALFFVTVAAVVGPWLAVHVFKSVIPSIVIEIILGYLIGSHGLHIAVDSPRIQFLADFGFSYLMFLSGIELDFDLMFQKQERGQAPWLRGLLFFVATLVIALTVSIVLLATGANRNLLLNTMLLSTTSLGLVTPALKESGWIRHPFGQEVLLYALIADVATLIVFTAYITFHSTGNAFSFLLIMVLLLFFGVVYRVLRAAQRFAIFRVVENATSEVGLRASFALVLAFLAFSQSLGTEVVIGAFLAGAIISLLSEKHSLLNQKLNSIGYGFFIPIFFVHVGMQFSLSALVASPSFYLIIVVLFVTMYLNKLLPAQWFFRKFPQPHRWAAGFLLSSRLSLMIAASQIARQAGLLSNQMSNAFVLLAIVTCVLSPALFNQVIRVLKAPEDASHATQALSINRDTLPDGWVIRQIEVTSRHVVDIPLRTFHLSPDLLLISIIRGDERIVPRGHTKLEQFDVAQVMGTPEALDKVEELLSRA